MRTEEGLKDWMLGVLLDRVYDDVENLKSARNRLYEGMMEEGLIILSPEEAERLNPSNDTQKVSEILSRKQLDAVWHVLMHVNRKINESDQHHVTIDTVNEMINKEMELNLYSR